MEYITELISAVAGGAVTCLTIIRNKIPVYVAVLSKVKGFFDAFSSK